MTACGLDITPERHSEETFEDYKKRRLHNRRALKRRSVQVWSSADWICEKDKAGAVIPGTEAIIKKKGTYERRLHGVL